MTITLTIDNLDSLPDGGPTRFQAHNRSFEIGREQHLDWTLPDPGRYISGRHCEVRYENGAYWLYDTSTNGVFVNGSSQRVKSPYRLENGDRLSIGHYVIDVALQVDERPAQEPIASPSPAPANGDIWSVDGPAPRPVDRRGFMPEASRRREADFSDQFLEFPEIRQPERPERESPGADAWDARPSPPASRSASTGEIDPDAAQRPPGRDAGSVDTANTPPPVDPSAMRPMPGPAERRAAGVHVQPAFPPRIPAGQAQAGPSSASAFLAAFAAGAGVSPEALRSRNPEELAFEIGEFVKFSVDNLRQLLKARAAAKTMTKSASRTMISASDNNPLKFVPGTPEAIEVMFAHNRPGYLDAKHSLDQAFADLKRHDLATYAAMQKALAKLVEEFAPDAIEQKVASAAFPLKKSRAWDAFVAKWEERDAGENGMLDTFLDYFAEAYDQASGGKKADKD
ncbi:type VI secretion system-associated FHA domain protein TagH [Arvimicrobium flavum]|uniref:type VI secretion system-associated FHA domain protein TagH n=1 Tax=Arvimicrobium flavum TaxID=3393320 RepID=UPI00237B70BE|nr:type VI secretion system-associated FHA domain protein TagH [Mesorhizobium shangrilense]